MRGLSSELQQLVDAGRIAAQPSVADSVRVLKGIQARLGMVPGIAGVAMVATATEGAVQALIARTVAKAAVGLALGVAGVAVVHFLLFGAATQRDAITPVALASAAALTDATAETATIQAQNSSLPNATITVMENQPTPEIAPAVALGSRRSHDTLADEVAILSRAEGELHRGRAQQALVLLGEHERRYKNGILAEERMAARIQALCALERVTEANTLLGKLSPQSLHGASSRQACATAKNGSPVR
jgi:hypothetical protein